VLRRIGAVVAGLVVAFVLVQAAEMGVHAMYPFPAGMNERDMTQIKAFVATLPTQAFALVLAGWLLGTLAGTFIAAKIGRSRVPAYIAGALLLCAGVANSILIPQPVWFSAVSFVTYVGGTLVSARLGAPRAAAVS
jgi:hypothetical protein